MNHHQAQAIQQRDDGQQQRIGVGREAPHRQMRTGEQGEIGDGVLGQVPAQALFLIGLDDEQRHRRDHRGEPEQEQFGVAPVRHRRHDGDRGLRLRRHDAARQLVPGSGGGGGSAVTVGDGVGGGAAIGGGGGAGEAVTGGGVSGAAVTRGRRVRGGCRPGVGARRRSAGVAVGEAAVSASASWWSVARAAHRPAAASCGPSSSIWPMASSTVPDGQPGDHLRAFGLAACRRPRACGSPGCRGPRRRR